MEVLEREEKEVRNKVEDQGDIIEFKKGLMGDIDESFFAGIIEEMRDKLKNQTAKEDFTKNADSGLYLIINDLIELI